MSKTAACSTIPGSSLLTLTTTRKPCQVLFLTPSLPFHGILHHCQNNLDKIQCVFLGYVTNFLQAFSRLICSFSQMPLSPRATETRSCLIWRPRLLPVGIFLTEGSGPGLGGGQGLCTLDAEGRKQPRVLGIRPHWTSSQCGEWGPSPVW